MRGKLQSMRHGETRRRWSLGVWMCRPRMACSRLGQGVLPGGSDGGMRRDGGIDHDWGELVLGAKGRDKATHAALYPPAWRTAPRSDPTKRSTAGLLHCGIGRRLENQKYTLISVGTNPPSETIPVASVSILCHTSSSFNDWLGSAHTPASCDMPIDRLAQSRCSRRIQMNWGLLVRPRGASEESMGRKGRVSDAGVGEMTKESSRARRRTKRVWRHWE